MCPAQAWPRCNVPFCPFGDVCLAEYEFENNPEEREEKANCLCIQHPKFLCCNDGEGGRAIGGATVGENPCGSCFFDCVSDWRTYHCGLPCVWLLRVRLRCVRSYF